jgi:hypothetical protein
MKLNLPNRQRLLLILAGTGVSLLILDRIAVTPLTKHWQARTAEIDTLRKSVASGREMIARATLTQKQWADMQANALPKDPAQAEQDLVSALNRWGRSCGIDFGAIRLQWKRGASDRYSTLECRVDATGALSNLSRFLFEVENSPMALRVDAVELNARDDGGQKLALGLVVSGLRLAPLEGRQ